MASDENFLSRWSRRKIRARSSPEESQPEPAARPVPAPVTGAAPIAGAGSADGPASKEPAPLPAIESLTPESDFAPFMSREVDGDLRSKALKTLFSDPRYNVMDMMDVYVDDYSKPDPLPESWLAKMDQSWLGDKGGRDREEAERRKALAEARKDCQAGEQDEAQAATDEATGAATGAAAGLPDPDRIGAANPPREVGESGT